MNNTIFITPYVNCSYSAKGIYCANYKVRAAIFTRD